MIKIFESSEQFRFDVLRSFLEENGVETFEINKNDSVYPKLPWGKQELYVNEMQVERAKSLIEDFLSRENKKNDE